MGYKKELLMGMAGFCLVTAIGRLGAGVKMIKADGDPFSAVAKNELVVAYIYSLPQEAKQAKGRLFERIRRDIHMLGRFSAQPRYAQSGVYFMAVNQADMDSMAAHTRAELGMRDDLSHIRDMISSAPNMSIILFRRGVPYSKEPLVTIDQEAIRGFVERNFGRFIDVNLSRVREGIRRAERMLDTDASDGDAFYRTAYSDREDGIPCARSSCGTRYVVYDTYPSYYMYPGLYGDYYYPWGWGLGWGWGSGWGGYPYGWGRRRHHGWHRGGSHHRGFGGAHRGGARGFGGARHGMGGGRGGGHRGGRR